MAWKATFDQGVACYKRGDFEGALTHMNQAAELESSTFILYDSRAAVHEKLGNLKAALLDSKRVIDLAPDRWQGYVRSARLFDLLGKYGSVIKMVDHALSCLRPEDVQRHTQLLELKEKAVAVQADKEKQRSSHVARSSYLLGKLPVETLLEIFSILIDEHHTWAIKLSHVCGHWRQILVSTPSAWKMLVLTQKRPLQKLKMWKQRTKNRISRISINVLELDKSTIFAELQDLSWDNLWSLRTSGRTFLDLQSMLSDISTSLTFSKLGELILTDCASFDLLSCCLSGPSWNLRTLHLIGIVYTKETWWPQIPQLKELHLSGVIIHFSTRVFAAIPLLEKFIMAGQTESIDPVIDNDISPISMEKLRYLEFQGCDDHFRVVRAVTTPSITHFIMSNIAMMVDETLLLMTSRPSLVELRISNCSLSVSILPMLLFCTPNLETLQVSNVHEVANEVLDFLATKTTGPSQDLPCRALTHVDVSRCSDLTTSSLYAFVRTRVKYASKPPGSAEKCAVIASLNVNGCPNIEADMLPWFRSRVARFSCVYATKKDFKKDRRRNL